MAAEQQRQLQAAVDEINSGKLEQAFSIFSSLVQGFDESTDEVFKGRVFANYGNALAKSGKHRAALENFDKGLHLFRKCGDSRREMITLFNQALSNSAVQENDKAEAAFRIIVDQSPFADHIRYARSWLSKHLASQKAQDDHTPARIKGAQMLEFGFDNLPFRDVVARTMHSMATLEFVVQLLREKASCEEKYARSLRETSRIGQNTSVLSAFGSLLGAKTLDPITSDLGTIHSTLNTFRNSYDQEATNRLAYSEALNALGDHIAEVRSRHSHVNKRCISIGEEVIKAVKKCVANLVKAESKMQRYSAEEQVAKANLETATAAMQINPVNELEYKRCIARWEAIHAKLVQAQREVQQAGFAYVDAKKARDKELTNVTRNLQIGEEERLQCLSAVLHQLAEHERTMFANMQTHHVSIIEAIRMIDVDSDLRMFVHKKRLNAMMNHHIAEIEARKQKILQHTGRADPSTSAQLKDDDGDKVVPTQMPASAQLMYTQAYMREEDALKPVVRDWIAAIFANRGKEEQGGRGNFSYRPSSSSEASLEDVPDASVEIIETSIQANSDRSDTFDPVAIFDHVAGRRLFVKALNKARGKRQNITRQFDRFTIIMRRFLDACLAHHDVEGAKMIMILSETYFKAVEGEGGKEVHEFVQKQLLDHPFWQNTQFWEEAFYRSVREEVLKAFATQRARLDLYAVQHGIGRSEGAAEGHASVNSPAHTSDEHSSEASLSQAPSAAAAADGQSGHTSTRSQRSNVSEGSEGWIAIPTPESRVLTAPSPVNTSVEKGMSTPFDADVTDAEAVTADQMAQSNSTVHTPSSQIGSPRVTSPVAAGTPTTVLSARHGKAASASTVTTQSSEPPPIPRVLPGSKEWRYQYDQILFGQLGSYAMNMRLFGLPERERLNVVRRLAIGNGLPSAMLQLLVDNDMGSQSE